MALRAGERGLTPAQHTLPAGHTWDVSDARCNPVLSSYGERQLRWLDAQLAEGKHTLVMVRLPGLHRLAQQRCAASCSPARPYLLPLVILAYQPDLPHAAACPTCHPHHLSPTDAFPAAHVCARRA